jgi:cytochrome c oxidase cbb3-type subunit III
MPPFRVHIPVVFCGTLLFGFALAGAQAQRSGNREGTRRFLEFCAACHGADGKGGDKAPALVSAAGTTALSDADLFRIVHDGTKGGMPPFAQIGDANIRAVVRYVRMLQGEAEPESASAAIAIPGDADTGRTLFFGKAQCSTCHMMQGEGGFIAKDLTRYARNRAPDAIRRAITNPDAPLVPSSRVVSVTTRAGQRLAGVLRNEDNFTLELETEDGRYHSLERSDLTEVHYTDHSLMPRDYGARLTANELDDIVGFLIVSSQRPLTNVGQNH